jgi:hypothetical protein
MCEPEDTLVREGFNYDGIKVMMFGLYQGLDLWILQYSDAEFNRRFPYKSRVFQCACMS